jgi:hypothetical protein
MNWILAVVVIGCFGVVCILLWLQVRSDREFREWLERQ